MTRILLLVSILALATSYTWAAALLSSKILVVHDAAFDKADYSTFFSSLESKGYELTYRSTKDNGPALVKYEQKEFGNVFIFAPGSKSLPADLSPQKLVDFLKDNGNVMLTVSSDLSEFYRDFAREFDLEFEERGTQITDHFASVQDSDKAHGAVIVPLQYHVGKLPGMFPSVSVEQPFLYRGVAHRVGSNPLAFPVIRPTATSYSFEVPSVNSLLEKLDNPDRNVLLGSDSDASLISAFQLLDTDRRNSAENSPKRSGSAGRVVWCGSMAAFSNELISMTKFQSRDGARYSGNSNMHGNSNMQVLSSLVAWLTQSHGVLKVESTSHERVKLHPNDNRETYEEYQMVDADGQSKHIQNTYRIMDTVTYHIDLSQHTPEGWTPAPTDLDLQVSLVMLDPYITANLTAASPVSLQGVLNSSPSSSSVSTPTFTRYSATFRLPDKHGVYTFVVDWKRHGWSYIHTRDTTSVRPFNHDEHPRGLHSAWPYVTGATTTAVGFLIFVYLWVCSDEADQSKKEKKIQ